MARNTVYQSNYQKSWALVVGINDYQLCGKLGYARNDAQAVADVLVSDFQFPKENVKLLLDGEATKQAILDALLAHSEPGVVSADDRLLVFFAGHGETVSGNRGEVGYLVPVDGDCDKLATLIRWDELTRNADMIPAKHVLFIMDACYGGLAVKRHVAPGSRRFLKDMLRRYSRQVLTAGKEDELVADEGGPRPGHSIFTGHLLEALGGKAASKAGFITANGVMAYVYDRVATDHHSDQTPHYGFIDGDGDFVFSELPAAVLTDNPQKGTDVVVEVPASLVDQHDPTTEQEQFDLVKEYLSEPRFRIKLDDLVNATVRATMLQTGDAKFPLSAAARTGQDVAGRLKAYEDAVRPLQAQAVLLGKWASADQRTTLTSMLARMSDNCTSNMGGSTLLTGMRWYPLSLLMYSSGIAALAAENYGNFAAIHLTRIDAKSRRGGGPTSELLLPVCDGMLDMAQANAWKVLPGQERKYTPESEYLYQTLQPVLEDLLFLGTAYDPLFDRYEVLRALMYADLTDGGWGPIGRFGWKHSNRFGGDSPYTAIRAEADQRKDQWGPIRAGLFRGSYARFLESAKRFEEGVLSKVNWF